MALLSTSWSLRATGLWLSGAILASTSAPALAEREQDPWYEVELIIFEYTAPEALLAEKWPLEPGYPNSEQLIELRADDKPAAPTAAPMDAPQAPLDLNTNATPPPAEDPLVHAPEETNDVLDQAYRLLESHVLNLNDEFAKLEGSDQHRPLFHAAWRMQVPSRAAPARIHVSNNVARLLPLVDPASAEGLANTDMPMMDVVMPDEVAPLMPAIPTGNDLDLDSDNTLPALDGVISISVARYLHVDLDVLFRSNEPLPSDGQDIYAVMPEPFVDETLLQEPVTEPAPFRMDEFGNIVMNNELSPEAEAPQVLVNDLIRVQGNLRMRSKEIHYLDHPKVGMIIQFLPYEVATEEDVSAE